MQAAALLWQQKYSSLFSHFFFELFASAPKSFIFAPSIGRLTQLVQSASLTRRKSGVRVPHCPPKRNPSHFEIVFRFFYSHKALWFFQLAQITDAFQEFELGYFPCYKSLPWETQIVEVHIFDFSRDIYNKEIKVDFIRKIRDEKKFSSLPLLRKQLEIDEINCKKCLGIL